MCTANLKESLAIGSRSSEMWGERSLVKWNGASVLVNPRPGKINFMEQIGSRFINQWSCHPMTGMRGEFIELITKCFLQPQRGLVQTSLPGAAVTGGGLRRHRELQSRAGVWAADDSCTQGLWFPPLIRIFFNCPQEIIKASRFGRHWHQTWHTYKLLGMDTCMERMNICITHDQCIAHMTTQYTHDQSISHMATQCHPWPVHLTYDHIMWPMTSTSHLWPHNVTHDQCITLMTTQCHQWPVHLTYDHTMSPTTSTSHLWPHNVTHDQYISPITKCHPIKSMM